MGKSGKIKETEAEKANAQVAWEQWEEYQRVYRPTELKFIADVMGDQSGLKNKAAGRVNADVMQNAKTTTVAGLDPNRMAGSSAFSTISNVKGQAAAKAKQAVDDRQAAGMSAITALGQGKAATAQQGFESLAAQSVAEEASKLQAKQTTSDAYSRAIMTGIGGGLAAYNNMPDAAAGEGVSVAAGDDMYNTVNPVARYYKDNNFSALPTSMYGPRR